jgi:hypothetical protein
MRWTRMADRLGGYFTVAQCYGEKIGIRVYKATGNGRRPWVVEVGGKDVSAEETCSEAKEVAVRLAMKWRGEVASRVNPG